MFIKTTVAMEQSAKSPPKSMVKKAQASVNSQPSTAIPKTTVAQANQARSTNRILGSEKALDLIVTNCKKFHFYVDLRYVNNEGSVQLSKPDLIKKLNTESSASSLDTRRRCKSQSKYYNLRSYLFQRLEKMSQMHQKNHQRIKGPH